MNFFAECNEPKIGRMLRRVKDFSHELDHVIEVHEKLMQVPNFLDDNDALASLQALLDPSVHIVEVEGAGLIVIDQVIPGLMARIHCTFWDRRLRGREKLCKSVMDRFVKEYNLQGIYCQNESSMIWRFLERVGFQSFVEEGYMRQYEYVVDPRYLHGANRTQRGSSWEA